MARRRLRTCWSLVGAIGLLLTTGLPAKALVPYVYVPQRQELEGAGMGIAQAAARLLRLGQAGDAARLAALTVQLLPEDPRGWVLLAEAQLRSNQLEHCLLRPPGPSAALAWPHPGRVVRAASAGPGGQLELVA